MPREVFCYHGSRPVLQSAGLKAGHPGRSAGLGRKMLGGAGLKKRGIWGDFEGFEAIYKRNLKIPS